MATKKEKSIISKEQLYAYFIERLVKDGIDLKPILSNKLTYTPQEQLYLVNKGDDLFIYELEERPIPTGSAKKDHQLNLSNDVDMLIECEPCENQLLDTKVSIAGQNLCWISYMDKEDFVRDLQAVITRYRI